MNGEGMTRALGVIGASCVRTGRAGDWLEQGPVALLGWSPTWVDRGHLEAGLK